MLGDCNPGEMCLLARLIVHVLNEALVAFPGSTSYQRMRLALQCCAHTEARIRLCQFLGIAEELNPLDALQRHLRDVVVKFTTSLSSQAAHMKDHLMVLL